MRTRMTVAIPLIVFAAVLAVSTTALAYESGTVDPALTSCVDCHESASPTTTYGPHGGYSTTSNKCQMCHSTHTAAGGHDILRKDTIRATCELCHDGTGGEGVYGVLESRGVTATASHSMDTTSLIPGGNPTTGGSIDATFTGESGNLSCDDCHSPHGANEASRTVLPFAGDRLRSSANETTITSNRLLLRRPGNSATDTPVYGTDWCLACHQGRSPLVTAVGNHSVDSALTTAAPFSYANVAAVATDTPTTATVLAPLARSNRGYVMPVIVDGSPNGTRTPEQLGHKPICQQCHEDSRNVGGLLADGVADVETYTATLNGASASANPRFQVFPHEAENKFMLVEPAEQLCGNCHVYLTGAGHGTTTP